MGSFTKMASNNNIIVVANTLHAEGEKIYNTSFAFDRSGRLLARLVENLRLEVGCVNTPLVTRASSRNLASIVYLVFTLSRKICI